MVDYRPRSHLKGVEYRTPHHRDSLHLRSVDTKSTTFSRKVDEKLPPFLKKWWKTFHLSLKELSKSLFSPKMWSKINHYCRWGWSKTSHLSAFCCENPKRWWKLKQCCSSVDSSLILTVVASHEVYREARLSLALYPHN